MKKCQCVSIQSSIGRVVDTGIALLGEKIPYVGNEPVHILGGMHISLEALYKYLPTSKLQEINSVKDEMSSLLT